MKATVLLECSCLKRLPRNPQTVLPTEGAKNTIKKIMRLRKSEINLFFFFFFHMRVKGIFVSPRNYLLEIAGGLKKRLNRLSVRKLREVNYPACLLSSGGHTHEN